MHHPRDTTLVVKTFLRDPYLFACIDSFKEHYDWPVVIADDGNHTDEKRKLGTYLELPFDSGLPYGRNRAIEAVETEFVLLVDDDSFFTGTERLGEMQTLLEVADVVTGTLYDVQTNIGTDYVARLEIERTELKMHQVRKTESYKGIPYKVCDLGLNLLMARTETLLANPWDERFKISFEHLDWFLSAKQAGLRVVHAPRSRFGHRPDVEIDNVRYMKLRLRKPWRAGFFQKWGLTVITNLHGHQDHQVPGGKMGYRLVAPNGNEVTVESAVRRDELVNNRGYTLADAPKPKKTTRKKTTRKK